MGWEAIQAFRRAASARRLRTLSTGLDGVVAEPARLGDAGASAVPSRRPLRIRTGLLGVPREPKVRGVSSRHRLPSQPPVHAALCAAQEGDGRRPRRVARVQEARRALLQVQTHARQHRYVCLRCQRVCGDELELLNRGFVQTSLRLSRASRSTSRWNSTTTTSRACSGTCCP